MRLVDKIAIITGGSRGMGAAEAKLFHAEGATVVVTDIDSSGAELVKELGDRSIFIDHDVGDEGSWSSLMRHVDERFGRADILINNAGINREGSVIDTSLEMWEQVIRINQTGVFLGTKAVVPLMQKAGAGSIVNISSGAGLRSAPGLFAYTASKWAVRGMTKGAAKELAPFKIRVNSIHPGVVDTPMAATIPNDLRAEITAQIPMKRWAEPDEIARAALFLSSAEGSYVTGAELAVDGGTVL